MAMGWWVVMPIRPLGAFQSAERAGGAGPGLARKQRRGQRGAGWVSLEAPCRARVRAVVLGVSGPVLAGVVGGPSR